MCDINNFRPSTRLTPDLGHYFHSGATCMYVGDSEWSYVTTSDRSAWWAFNSVLLFAPIVVLSTELLGQPGQSLMR